MGAASALVDTTIAKAPVTLIALIALPETFVGRRQANVTEESGLQPTCWIFIRHLAVSVGGHLGNLRRSFVFEGNEDMPGVEQLQRAMVRRC